MAQRAPTQVQELLAATAAGAARCLVFEGDPGIGKTALLDFAATAARLAEVVEPWSGPSLRVASVCGKLGEWKRA
jgi:hypothetical protein